MRRKVLKAELETYGHCGSNMYNLMLDCGHKELGYGRGKDIWNRKPPKTATCLQCKNLALATEKQMR